MLGTTCPTTGAIIASRGDGAPGPPADAVRAMLTTAIATTWPVSSRTSPWTAFPPAAGSRAAIGAISRAARASVGPVHGRPKRVPAKGEPSPFRTTVPS